MNRLNVWFRHRNRKPLVIRGARQVGKSTLTRLFAMANGLKLYEVNLERHPELKKVFKSRNSDQVLQELEYLIGEGPIRGGKAVLFIDEIQAIPDAIPMLRYLHEDRPELAVVAAGSLLEIVLAEHGFTMPVGRIEYLFLEPMSFSEFLIAVDEHDLRSLLTEYKWGDSFPSTAHERLLRLLRDYLLIGGMPEAVLRYSETGDHSSAAEVHSSILNTWRDDFSKYANRADVERLHKVFDFVPAAIGEKFKYVCVDREERSGNLKRALTLLSKAKLIRRVYHSDGTGIPLGSTIKENTFKTYFLDVGLVNSACGLSWISMDSMRDTAFANEGKLAEQFVVQHLPLLVADYQDPVPTYWLREGRSNNAEIDFLIQIGSNIVPVEVKSGKSGSLKSLLEFVHLRGTEKAVRFDLNSPGISPVEHAITHGEKRTPLSYTLMSLPLYMIEELPRLWETEDHST